MARWQPFVIVGAGVFVFIFYVGFQWRILVTLVPSRNSLPEEFSEISLEGKCVKFQYLELAGHLGGGEHPLGHGDKKTLADSLAVFGDLECS